MKYVTKIERMYLLTPTKIDVENKKRMVQDDPFSSTNALCLLIWMINLKYASQYDQMIYYLCYY